MVSMIDKIIDPPSVEAVKKLDDWPKWEVSIKNELDIHKRLKTGVLVKPPPNVNIIGSQIIPGYKLDKDGKISSCKSRLIAQGFTQQEGINFTDTFSPAKLTAVRIIVVKLFRTTGNWSKWTLMLHISMLHLRRTYICAS